MSTQWFFKSTVKRSSRLNPTLKKKLGFQKLEIEFISKSKKCPRSASKVSPVLFASQDGLSEKSEEVESAKFSFPTGNQSDVNSQNPITPSTGGTAPFADAVSESSVVSYDIRKFVNDGFDSQDFADEIRKLANEGLNSQDFAVEMRKRSNESFNSQDFEDTIRKFANDGPNSEDLADTIRKFAIDGLNSQNFAEAIEKFAVDSLNSLDFADAMRQPPNDDLNSQDLTDPVPEYLDPDLNSQNFAALHTPSVESTNAEVQTTLKVKPVRRQRKAPSTICDGNILPETFRKSTVRASKNPRSASQKMSKLRNKEAPMLCENNASLEPAKNLRLVSELKRPGASTAVKSYKRKTRNTFPDFNSLLEPLNVDVFSQKTIPAEMNVPEPAKNLQPIYKKKRGRRPRASNAARPAKRKVGNTFPDFNSLLEPLKIEVISQKTVPSDINVPELTKNAQSICKQKRGRKPRASFAARPARRKAENTFPDFNSLLEPLRIGDVSQKTVPDMNVPLEPVTSRQTSWEKKRKRKSRTNSTAKPAKRRYENTFPDFNLLSEPPKSASQKARPCARKPKASHGKPVVIRQTRLSDKKQADQASAEIELCSLFSNCSVKSSEDRSTSCSASKSDIFTPRPVSSFGTNVFINLPLSDLCRKDTDSANADDLSEFTDLFSMNLNVGNFSENLNVMGLLRQVTRVRKKLPHFVPPSRNWYEGFEIW